MWGDGLYKKILENEPLKKNVNQAAHFSFRAKLVLHLHFCALQSAWADVHGRGGGVFTLQLINVVLNT